MIILAIRLIRNIGGAVGVCQNGAMNPNRECLPVSRSPRSIADLSFLLGK
jgi:hypothetical protein